MRHSEFSPPKQYSRNSVPPVSYTEPSARVDRLTAGEATLKATKYFQEALTTLWSWREHVINVVTDLAEILKILKIFFALALEVFDLVSSQLRD